MYVRVLCTCPMYVGTYHTHTRTPVLIPCIYLFSSSSPPPRLVLGADCERYGHRGGVVPAAGAERVALSDDGYVEGRRPYAGGEGEGGFSETVPLLEAAADGGSTGRDETSAEEVDDADVSEGGWARRGAEGHGGRVKSGGAPPFVPSHYFEVTECPAFHGSPSLASLFLSPF